MRIFPSYPPLVQGVWSTSPRERMTARSIRFCNSRMLPGRDYHWNAAMVRRNRVDLFSHAVAELLHEMCHTSEDVCSALS